MESVERRCGDGDVVILHVALAHMDQEVDQIHLLRNFYFKIYMQFQEGPA